MGNRDDDWFDKRYEAGRKEVFFAINSHDSVQWIEAFCRVARERDLRPIYYSGAGHDIIPQAGNSNTLDDELRDDFYPAKTKVLYFGPPREGANYEDHWALGSIASVSADHMLIVYVSEDYPVEVLRRNGFKGTPIMVANPTEFEKSLREQIVV